MNLSLKIFVILLFSYNLAFSYVNQIDTYEKLSSILDNVKKIDKNELNKNDVEANKDITDQFKKRENTINKIILFINNNDQIDTGNIDNSAVDELKYKIDANKESGHTIAFERDNIKLNDYYNKIHFVNFINGLIDLRSKYSSEADINKFISANRISFADDKIEEYNNKLAEYSKYDDPIHNSYISAVDVYKDDINKYNIIIDYLEKNSKKIAKSNFIIQFFSLSYWTNIINDNINLFNINFYLDHYLKITIANIVLSIFALVSINLIRLFLFPLLINFINNKFNSVADQDKNILTKKYLIASLEKPFKYLIYLFSMEIFLKVLLGDHFYIDIIGRITSILYFVIFSYLFYKLFVEWIKYFSEEFFSKYPNVRREMISFLLKSFVVFLFILIIIFSLTQLNFDVKALLASLGVVGIAVALAAKETLSNFFSAINIMLDNSFSHGDWIVTSNYEGSVVEIRMRTTTLRTFDNALITIPNSELAGTGVINWDRRKIGRRIKMTVGVTYESNMDDIKNAVNDLRFLLENSEHISTEKYLLENDLISQDGVKKNQKLIKIEDELGIKKNIFVFLDSFGESSINISISAYTKTTDVKEWMGIKEELLYQISDIIKKNNLEFAYPTNVTWVKGISKPI